MGVPTDSTTISLRVPTTLANDLKKISAKQRRPLSQMCVFLIEMKLRELQSIDAFSAPLLPAADKNDD
jgi:hypothetical protein